MRQGGLIYSAGLVIARVKAWLTVRVVHVHAWPRTWERCNPPVNMLQRVARSDAVDVSFELCCGGEDWWYIAFAASVHFLFGGPRMIDSQLRLELDVAESL